MRGTVARAIRKTVYGEEMAPRFRKYRRFRATGVVIADDFRRRYNMLKKDHMKGV